jgi:AcrR family transcriptional regulator
VPPDAPHDTKTRLLDAAESLLASQGIGNTSLRQITEKAGVNLALVKYHFDSKDGLVAATLQRRLEPINSIRIRLLEELEARHPHGPLPLDDILTALIQPVVDLGLGGGPLGRQFLKLFGRIFSEPAAAMNVMRQQMGPMIHRFDTAFARALPHLTDSDTWESAVEYITDWWRNDALPLLYGCRDEQWDIDMPLSLPEMIEWRDSPAERRQTTC